MSYSDLHDTDHVIVVKNGLDANINTTATKNMATQAEPHWATDTARLYVFDGSNNVRVHGLDMAVVCNQEVICLNGAIVWLT